MSIPDPRDKALCCCPIATFVKKISSNVRFNGYIIIFTALPYWLISKIFPFIAFFPTNYTMVHLIMGIFFILCGILGNLAVSFQSKAEAGALYVVMRRILYIDFISSIVAIVRLFYASAWDRFEGIQSLFILFLPQVVAAKYFFFFGFIILSIYNFGRAWWIFSVLGSFKKVFKAGGTGWEKKNAEDVRTDLAAGNSRCRISQDGTILRTQSF
eukprot:GHVP01067510.1.p1 GENE.GHVP01067510.1~~GHVP01067510.1.p1  ORF type:complete len:213 (+),score=19.63 GHVP01067510.1:56-694(+)